MNLVYGEILKITSENGMNLGMIRIGGVLKKAPLNLLANPGVGDRVLLCDGIPIGKVICNQEADHVFGDSR